MDTNANPTKQGDLTSFDIAHGGAPGAPTCTSCSKPISDIYHEANGAVVCSRCRATLEVGQRTGAGVGAFLRAAALGGGAAAVGAAAYFAVAYFTGYELALVSIAVGWLVGRAVQIGSRGRGGRRYQALAMALTYAAIVVTYVPAAMVRVDPSLGELPVDSAAAQAAISRPLPVIPTTGALAPAPEVSDADDPALDTPRSERVPLAPSAPAVALEDSGAAAGPVAEDSDAAADSSALPTGATGAAFYAMALAAVFGLALAEPFLQGASNIIGLIIIAVALYQAWTMTKRTDVSFTGPYRVGTPREGRDPVTA